MKYYAEEKQVREFFGWVLEHTTYVYACDAGIYHLNHENKTYFLQSWNGCDKKMAEMNKPYLEYHGWKQRKTF